MKIYHILSNSLEHFNANIIENKNILSQDEGHIPRFVHWLKAFDKENEHIIVMPSSSLGKKDLRQLSHKWGFEIRLVKSFLLFYPIEFSIELIFFLRSLPKKNSILHFHGVTSPIYTSCIFFLSDRNTIANYRGGWFRLGKSFLNNIFMILGFKFLIPWTISKASLIISESKKMYELYRAQMPNKKIIYIPGCTNIPLLKNKGINSSGNLMTNLLFVGQLTHRKGIVDLLKAFSLLKSKKIRLTIIGDGPLKSIVNTYTDNDSRIVHISKVNNSELGDFYSATNIFILPTYNESFGWVLVEAMSYGVPVISTFVEGPVDIIDNEIDGLLIHPGDVKSLASKINLLSHNKILCQKLGENARKKVISKFSTKKVISQFLSIYSVFKY